MKNHFLDDSIYDSVTTAESARDGIYEGLTNYDAQERRYFIVNGFQEPLVPEEEVTM